MTSRIAGALVLAFIIFVVVRGELPSYLGVLGLNSSVPSPAPAAVAGTPQGSGGLPSPVGPSAPPSLADLIP